MLLGNSWQQWLIAALILAGALILRGLARLAVRSVRRRDAIRPASLIGYLVRSLTPAFSLALPTFGLFVALNPPILTFSGRVAVFVSGLLQTLAAILVCLTLGGIGLALIDHRMQIDRTNGADSRLTLAGFYRKAIPIFGVIVAVFLVLRIWGFDISGLLTGLGLGGLALTLAAQDTFSNLLGGITIMIDRFFLIGDWIATPEIEGVVEEIGIRSSKIRTFAQAMVTVPNAKLSNAYVTNYSRMGKRRVRFTVSLRNDAVPEALRRLSEVIVERLSARPGVHGESILVTVEGFTPMAIDLSIQAFVRTVDTPTFLREQQEILLVVQQSMRDCGLAFAAGANATVSPPVSPPAGSPVSPPAGSPVSPPAGSPVSPPAGSTPGQRL